MTPSDFTRLQLRSLTTGSETLPQAATRLRTKANTLVTRVREEAAQDVADAAATAAATAAADSVAAQKEAKAKADAAKANDNTILYAGLGLGAVFLAYLAFAKKR